MRTPLSSGRRCFNPPSPCGEGLNAKNLWRKRKCFNPPSPCGEGQKPATVSRSSAWFQSTLPVWGGTGIQKWYVSYRGVSIHPPRVGRDRLLLYTVRRCIMFQSTLPVWGGMNWYSDSYVDAQMFQSTLPVWGGITAPALCGGQSFSFNPPSPCGEGCLQRRAPGGGAGVSIHPPRVGRDGWLLDDIPLDVLFQSTLPVWGGIRYSPAQLEKMHGFQSTLPVWGGIRRRKQ